MMVAGYMAYETDTRGSPDVGSDSVLLAIWRRAQLDVQLPVRVRHS